MNLFDPRQPGQSEKINLGDLSLKLLETIFEHSGSAIELYDEKGILIDINIASLNLFGISSKSEIENFNFFDDPNITEERNEELLNGDLVQYETVINFDEVRKNKLFKTNKTGSILIKVTVAPMFDMEKDIIRILFIADEVKK
jgi:PAS domain S-box-containing protein